MGDGTDRKESQPEPPLGLTGVALGGSKPHCTAPGRVDSQLSSREVEDTVKSATVTADAIDLPAQQDVEPVCSTPEFSKTAAADGTRPSYTTMP